MAVLVGRAGPGRCVRFSGRIWTPRLTGPSPLYRNLGSNRCPLAYLSTFQGMYGMSPYLPEYVDYIPHILGGDPLPWVGMSYAYPTWRYTFDPCPMHTFQHSREGMFPSWVCGLHTSHITYLRYIQWMPGMLSYPPWICGIHIWGPPLVCWLHTPHNAYLWYIPVNAWYAPWVCWLHTSHIPYHQYIPDNVWYAFIPPWVCEFIPHIFPQLHKYTQLYCLVHESILVYVISGILTVSNVSIFGISISLACQYTIKLIYM